MDRWVKAESIMSPEKPVSPEDDGSERAWGLLWTITGAGFLRWKVTLCASLLGTVMCPGGCPVTLQPRAPKKKLEPQIRCSMSVGGRI